jgi:hypothetical protein
MTEIELEVAIGEIPYVDYYEVHCPLDGTLIGRFTMITTPTKVTVLHPTHKFRIAGKEYGPWPE